MSTLVDRIQDLCNSKGTTIAALERELGFGKGLIRTWKTGSPSSDKLQKVADFFSVSLDQLVGRCVVAEEVAGYQVDKAYNDLERRLLLLARKAVDIPEQQREDVINMFEKTINVYLKAKGIKGDD